MDKSTYFDLESMRKVDIQSIDPELLVDIRNINVDVEMPVLERTCDYINQAKNAYCIRCGKIAIKIEYSDTDISIEDCMEGYFRSLCGVL